MNHIELIITVEPKEQGSDVLITLLSELGFESFMENERGFSAYAPENNYDEDAVKKLFSGYSDFFEIHYSSEIIQQKNWNKEWESNFQPIEVDGKCYIRAPFHDGKKNFLYDIIIEPKMSFGTGHHNTTQLMIQKLLTLELENKSLLDMGCGTGVLAILASKMGANPIMAIDVDEWSYENAIENLQKNSINNVFVHKGDVQILAGKKFHTILANINKNVLLSDMNNYVSSLERKGDLVMSGFFETDSSEITSKASELGLKCIAKVVNNQWTMLHFVNLN